MFGSACTLGLESYVLNRQSTCTEHTAWANKEQGPSLVKLSSTVDDVGKMVLLTAHGLRGHPRVCSLGGVGYLGSVGIHLALAAQKQQTALVYHTW